MEIKNKSIALLIDAENISSNYIETIIDEANKYEANLLLNEYLEKGDTKVLEELKAKHKSLYELALYIKAKENFYIF